MSHHIVQAKELYFTYPDGKEALSGVNFTIRHGESVALIGANGAGKSTLLLHLNGCYAPKQGTVRIGDDLVTPKTLAKVRQSVGMIFQDADDQLFMSTVFDDVAFGPLNLGLSSEEVEQRVTDALNLVGALKLKDRAPYHLSGGEKRMCAIATVMAMGPEILVMDEPSSNLDPRARRRLIELLKGFRHTKILATHDLDMVLELCHRTIVLKDGKVEADGPTTDIFGDEVLLQKCHLEKPLRMQGCPICSPKTSALGDLPKPPPEEDPDHHHHDHDLPHEHEGTGIHHHHHGSHKH